MPRGWRYRRSEWREWIRGSGAPCVVCRCGAERVFRLEIFVSDTRRVAHPRERRFPVASQMRSRPAMSEGKAGSTPECMKYSAC